MGGSKLFGDANQSIKIIELAKDSKKRISGVWIPPTSEITPQKQPLGVYFMNITGVISDFCIMLQNFVGKGKFGKSENGQCLILWWKLTALAKSNHKGSRIALSDIIEWKSINHTNLAHHPPKNSSIMKLAGVLS